VEICPQCGAKLTKGSAFCSGCGYKLPEAEKPAEPAKPVCSGCGAELLEGALFCTACGQKVE